MARELELLGELEKAGAITPTSLSIDKADLPFEEWSAVCGLLGSLRSASCWWIGDLLIFGEGAYGERYAQAMDEFGLDYSTLTNYAYVCRNVARRRRRRSLSFAHHRLVAPLEPQEQSEWLGRAQDAGWTRQQLQDALNAIEPGDGGGESGTPGIKVEDAARQVWMVAQKNGSTYIVPAEPMLVLASALGIETA